MANAKEPEVQAKSSGVQRIEVISTCFTRWHKVILLISIFLIAYTYGLDGQTRSTYQSYATASYSQHSLLSTINVVKSIVAAASQPAFAKASDVFGREVILGVAVLFYTLGTVIEAVSHGVAAFCGGAVVYTFGWTALSLTLEVLVADTTSLRSRMIASYIPALPFIINTWASGDVAEAVIEGAGWRWGIGCWAIVMPFISIPLFWSLYDARTRARKQGLLAHIPSVWAGVTNRSIMTNLFWQTDLAGLFLLAASLTLILVPFTIAGGVKTQWQQGHVIAPLVVGLVVALPGFLIWELKVAKHPLLPFSVLKNRTILAGLLIACCLQGIWYIQGQYLYTVLIVAFDQSIKSAQRISSLYSFVAILTGTCIGLLVRYVRRLKYFIVFGTFLYMIGFGMLIHYRGPGGSGSGNLAGLIGSEIVLGIGGGLIPYSTQTLVQAAVPHEILAVITGVYLASYNVGAALGTTICGAIWSQKLPVLLVQALGARGAEFAKEVYEDPYTFVAQYPAGTPEREAVNVAYQEIQRLLCIAGIVCCAIPIVASFFLHNYRLTDAQTREELDAASVASTNDSGDDTDKKSVV